MDLGLRKSNFCIHDALGNREQEGVISSSRESVAEFFSSQEPSRVILEACGPCRWIAEIAKEKGHEVVVANPRTFRLISHNPKKCDLVDARTLADVGQVRPTLLHPVYLRGTACQIARGVLAARDKLVRSRTKLINFVRAEVAKLGYILPSCGSGYFHTKVEDSIPKELSATVAPLLDSIRVMTEGVANYDKEINRISNDQSPETGVLAQIKGVGPITALAFVITIEDPRRFNRSRTVGAYLGLTPRVHQSCGSNPQLPISKHGDEMCRRLLVSAATFILAGRGGDSALYRFGKRLEDRGSQAAKSKARIAVARKLSVVMHRLLITGEVLDPFHGLEESEER